MPVPEVQFFVEEFNDTLSDARKVGLFTHELDNLFVLAVQIQPAEIELDEFYGALWIPPLRIREQIEGVQHWRGLSAFYGVETKFNERFSNRYFLRPGNFRGYIWLECLLPERTTLLMHDDPFPLEGMKEQVVKDFGINLQVSS